MRRSVEIDPVNIEFRINLAEALRRLGDVDSAATELQRVIEIDPSIVVAHRRLAVLLSGAGQHERAIPPARRTLELEPNDPIALATLGQSLMEIDCVEEAIPVLEHCLKVAPQHAFARFLHDAATGATPPAPPPNFVAGVFDPYAKFFDEHLAELQYSVPAKLSEAVDRVRPEGKLDVLDLGCGTGLVGAAFADRAASLIGVDVSEPMLARAFARKIYTRLEMNDVLLSLKGRTAEMDLILAGDVFIYVGELRDVFAATANALRPDGLFAFSIELQNRDGYFLRPSRRYAHSRKYIEDLAAAYRFEILVGDEVALRHEQSRDVTGVIYVLRRPSA
jgi:predicted TPR repeat methyltransferase